MDHEHVSAIQRVPAEIWRKVFIALHDISNMRDDFLDPPQNEVHKLCKVCRRWRTLAIETSYLWRIITFIGLDGYGPISSLDYFASSFVRSGQQRLQVTVWLTPRYPMEEHGHTPQIPGIVARIMAHIHRVEHLVLRCGTQITSMERVFVTNPMTLLDRNIVWSGIPTGTLQSLELTAVTFPTVESIYLVLRDCRQLQNLRIWNVFVELYGDIIPKYSVSPLCLPSLEIAHLDFDLLLDLQVFSLSMPRLKDHIIFCPAPDSLDDDPLKILLPHTLEKLTLRGPFSDEHVLSIFCLPVNSTQTGNHTPKGRFPRLDTLKLQGCQAGTALMSFLSDTSISMLSELHDLEILCGTTSDDEILRVLHSYTITRDDSDDLEEAWEDIDDDGLVSESAQAIPARNVATTEVLLESSLLLRIEGCPHTTEKLRNMCMSWTKKCAEEEDFEFEPYLAHFQDY